MKQFLKKPLGLAVAATLAMGGMAAFTSANAAVDANALGDLAIVPYYTVRENAAGTGNFETGIHITNTSNATQVVKLRLRRSSDSADALDFNIIMSPNDMWTGSINKQAGKLGISTTDTTCTAPAATSVEASGKARFVAPNVFAANGAADEGYIEIIGMAQTIDEAQPIAVGALHTAAGTPADCAAVRNNFELANVAQTNGNLDSATTASLTSTVAGASGQSAFTDTPNVLKVKYFIRDLVTGMEMGDNATHISDFMTAAADNTVSVGAAGAIGFTLSQGAMMTNQAIAGGLFNANLTGFDFPDLDGGVALQRGRYDAVIRADLGADSILNDWSFNPANGVATDWVITIPGQYLMDNPSGVVGDGVNNGSVIINGLVDSADSVNHRDLPVVATFDIFDREEAQPSPGGGLSISPSRPVDNTASFVNEVNVLEWGGQKVFNTASPRAVDQLGDLTATSGWASLEIDPQTSLGNTVVGARLIYDQTDQTGATLSGAGAGGIISNLNAPVIGFTGWKRSFDDANKNYGHLVGHSRR